MLCSAATDIYTQCGLERVINLDKLPAYTLHHLPNKYIGRMGLPEQEMRWQIEALRERYLNGGHRPELFEVETRLPDGVGSKFFREQPDGNIEGQLLDAKRVLVYGAGDGAFEAKIQADGPEVFCLPLDSVARYCCRKRGLGVVGIEDIHPSSPHDRPTEPYDAIVMRDVLHLVANPIDLLSRLEKLLRPGGQVVCRIPNLYSRGMLFRRLFNRRFPLWWSKARVGCQPYDLRQLKGLLNAAGFERRSGGYGLPTAELGKLYREDLTARLRSPFIYVSGYAVDDDGR